MTNSNLLAIGSLVARGFWGGCVCELETRSEGRGNRCRTWWATLRAFTRGVSCYEKHTSTRSLGVMRKGWIVRSLGLGIECGHKLCHGGAQRRCGDVQCLGLGIERGDEHCHCDAREIAGMPGAWDRSLSEAPRAALRSLGAGWNLSSGRGDRYLQGLPTCSGPDVRVCCPLLLYIFIDSLQSFSHCLMTSS